MTKCILTKKKMSKRVILELFNTTWIISKSRRVSLAQATFDVL